MIFQELPLAGALVIDIERREDTRGFFARAWCRREFEARGLRAQPVQTNISYNRRRGTVRGFHYQAPPYGEAKLIRCTRGAIHDVIIDVRPSSPTYAKHHAVQLSAERYRMLYVPEGFAQAFQTLQDETEVTYQVSEYYTPEAERGIRHNDRAFGIDWPLEVTVISDKDRSWPDFGLVPPQRVQ
jgi:dTDP-4-dehydrorhamnose 3,5-epimerase